MAEYVLDASAVLALVNQESGAETVEKLIDESCISAVNLAETATRLSEKGLPNRQIRQLLGELGIPVVTFDEELAYQASELRRATRKVGLSLGDRACLATAGNLRAIAVTADRGWADLKLPTEIRFLR